MKIIERGYRKEVIECAKIVLNLILKQDRGLMFLVNVNARNMLGMKMANNHRRFRCVMHVITRTFQIDHILGVKAFEMKEATKVFLLRLVVISAMTYLVWFGMLLLVNGFQYPTSPSGVVFIAGGSVFVVIGGILLVNNIIKAVIVR